MEPLSEDNENKLTTKAVYDYRLVKLAIENGDQKAYAELLQRYRESVYFMMMKMCNNKDDAEDLTIEAFGRAFKKLEQYSPEYAFSTWLFKIASNNAIDFIRRKKQKYAVSIDAKTDNTEAYDHSSNIRASGLDPEENFIRKQKIESVRILVDNLKPKYKEMIELFYFQEMSHEEISQILNLPIGTIKAQLFRARDLLYNALKGGGPVKTSGLDTILSYFPALSSDQINSFAKMQGLYEFWNSQINVISRKDMDFFYERHVLHSLGIAKVIQFKPGTKILDVGTGGGFPGIPLAILFPEVSFTLVDSVGKKIKVVDEVAKALNLNNVNARQLRVETLDQQFDFVVSRAVTEFPEFYNWTKNKFLTKSFNDLPNGILYLKGGDLEAEFGKFYSHARFYNLKDFFKEEFFETKKVVYYKM